MSVIPRWWYKGVEMRPMLRCADKRLKVKDGESRDSLSRLSGCIHTKKWCDVNRLLRHDASRVGEKMVVAVVVVVPGTQPRDVCTACCELLRRGRRAACWVGQSGAKKSHA